jgi:hypothetical protein
MRVNITLALFWIVFFILAIPWLFSNGDYAVHVDANPSSARIYLWIPHEGLLFLYILSICLIYQIFSHWPKQHLRTSNVRFFLYNNYIVNTNDHCYGSVCAYSGILYNVTHICIK